MHANPLFMMIHPNASEYNARSYFVRSSRDGEVEDVRGSSFPKLESSPKEYASGRPKRGKDSGHRAGDWICNLCNNHNYSFREICNSCKTQTKIENLRQSLSVLTAGEPTQPIGQKPSAPRKRLQLKSGEKFEESLRANFQETRVSIDIGVCQDVPPPNQVSPATERGLFQAFEDSFNEYPFEKACLMDLGMTEGEPDDDGEVDDGDSLQLDKETLKILSFD